MSDGDKTEAVAPAEKRGAKRYVVGVLLLAAVGAVGFYGGRWYIHSQHYESTDDAFVEGHVVTIAPRVSGTVATVYVNDNQLVHEGDLLVRLDPADLETALASAKARYEAAKAAKAAAASSLEITRVQSSTTTAWATARVATAKAGIATAQAAVATAESQATEKAAAVGSSRAAVDQAKADAVAAEVLWKRDQEDLHRAEELFKGEAIPKQDLDHAAAAEAMSKAALQAKQQEIATKSAELAEAEAAVSTAQAEVSEAKGKLTQVQASLEEAKAGLMITAAAPHQVDQGESHVSSAEADLLRAEADVTQAELNLSYATIRAPVTGHVTRKSVEAGSFVQSGQSLLAVVPREVWVVANFKETQLEGIEPGQPVEISVDAYPGREFHGVVDSLQRGTGARFSLLPPENATGNYIKVTQRVPVRIRIDDTLPENVVLVPGMSVIPEVQLAGTTPADKKETARATR